MRKDPTCPYCGNDAKLVKGSQIYKNPKPEIARKNFWQCKPCNAYVGCHIKGDGKVPFGTLANDKLRVLRGITHRTFDGLWIDKRRARKMAYLWLAQEMGITPDKCHIGKFDERQCREAIRIVNEKGAK